MLAMSRAPNKNRGSWGGGQGRGINERAKQLGDQEKWLEEKKREAEAKLAAREEEKAAEKRAAAAGLQSGALGGKKTALGKFSAARFGLKVASKFRPHMKKIGRERLTDKKL